MFYPKLLEIKELGFASELIEQIDKWLAFLPDSEKSIITAGKVSRKFGIDYTLVEVLLNKLYDIGILDETYIILCPECEKEIRSATRENLVDVMQEINYCYKCDTEIKVTMEDIIFSYKLIQEPQLTENELKEYASKVLGVDKTLSKEERLSNLLDNGKKDLNDFFIHPLKHN